MLHPSFFPSPGLAIPSLCSEAGPACWALMDAAAKSAGKRPGTGVKHAGWYSFAMGFEMGLDQAKQGLPCTRPSAGVFYTNLLRYLEEH